MFLGLRTAIYHVPDIAKAKAWYSAAFGLKPYFDQPFYVGFNIGGYELGLVPDSADQKKATGVVAYWGVDDPHAVMKHLLASGATMHEDIQDVGEGILVAEVLDPFGNHLGIIKNPHFTLGS